MLISRSPAHLGAITVASHGHHSQVRGQVHSLPCLAVGLRLAPGQAPHTQPACLCPHKQEMLVGFQKGWAPISLQPKDMHWLLQVRVSIHIIRQLIGQNRRHNRGQQ